MELKMKAKKESCKKQDWQEIYKKWFGMDVDFSDLEIPAQYNDDNYFIVMVAKNMTLSQVFLGMEKKLEVFYCLRSENLKNERNPSSNYFVVFKKNTEADEELKDLSAVDLSKSGHQGVTLLERLLLEIFYFNSKNDYLESKTMTLCSGSRYLINNVPSVFYNEKIKKLCVYWALSVESSYEELRSRSVVFCS
jgi:hypothetical protein